MAEQEVAKEPPPPLPASDCAFDLGGGDGSRTHCLYIANVALYQLSYTPGCVGKTSRHRNARAFSGGSGASRCGGGGGGGGSRHRHHRGGRGRRGGRWF